jgi:uncharacterized repeat protein (TIGR03803 family)
MRNRFMLTLLIAIPTFAGTLLATDVTNLYSFTGIPDGNTPIGSLVADAAGNLYGVTFVGGTLGGCTRNKVVNCGTVFELKPGSGGTYTETIIHDFGGAGDGQVPLGGLIIDQAGNLYGTTSGGGVFHEGIVFQLSPQSGGGWTETILYNFGQNNASDASEPGAGLIFDSAGNLYGTTQLGGATDNGAVFELSPPSGSGAWTENVLYSFQGGSDGSYPYGGLAIDYRGALYGTTHLAGLGGEPGYGTLFELVPPSGGSSWTESVLHRFTGKSDGGRPQGNLLRIGQSLYGTTSSISGGAGTVFEVSPSAGGVNFETIYTLPTSDQEGNDPTSGVILGPGDELLGTAQNGGDVQGGTIFELVPHSGGAWTFSLVATLGDFGLSSPQGLFIHNGRLYGVASYGGDQHCVSGGSGVKGCGAVFSIAP